MRRWSGVVVSVAGFVAALLVVAPRWAEGQTTFNWTTLSSGNASGSWNTAANWNSGAGPVASGADNTADFSTLDITADSTVTLDGNKTIGHLIFGDTNTGTPANWIVDAGSPFSSTLTLAVTSGSPTITTNTGVATINSIVAGSAGLTKEGTGTLVLTADSNTYSGGTTINNGVLRIEGFGFSGQLGSGAVTNNASLVFSLNSLIHVDNTISGAGSVTVTDDNSAFGTSLPYLRASNSYSGMTTISSNGELIASDGVGLPNSSFLNLDGGVFMADGTSTFTRSLDTSGSGKFQWSTNGGGFAVNGGQLTVNIGGAGAELVWGTTVGSEIVGPLRFGSAFNTGTTLLVNGIDLNSTLTAATRTIRMGNGIAEISGAIRNSNAAGGLAIESIGLSSTLVLSGSNTYTGTTTIGNLAILRANDGAGLPTASFLSLNGGLLEGSGTTSFTRSLGTSGSGKFQWESSISGGGFSASGGDFTVNIGGAGGELVWGTTVGSQIVGELRLGSSDAGSKTLLVNGIDLNDDVGTALRTIRIVGSSGVGGSAEISGVIRNSNVASDLYFIGNPNLPGTLILSASNIYTGRTTINSIALRANDGVGLPTGSFLELQGGVLEGDGVTSFTRSLGTSGSGKLQWSVLGGGFAAHGGQFTVNIGGAGGELVWGTMVGSQIVSTLRFGARDANAKTLFVNGIDLNNTSTAATRTIRLTPGAGGDSAEISGAIRNSNAAGNLSIISDAGSPTLILSGNNTYSGTTAIGGFTIIAKLQIGNGGTTGTLGSGSVTISSSSSLIFNRSDSMTVGNAISGSGGSLIQAGAGTTILTGGNSYSTTTVSAGVLQIGNGGTTGSLGTNSVTNNASLVFNRSDSITVANDIDGSGSLTQAGSGTTIVTNSSSNYSGGTIISSGVLQVGNGGTSGAIGSGAVTNNASLVFNRSNSIAVGNVISGTGSLTKMGAGTLTLTGANGYMGDTIVNAGGLTLSGSGSLANSPTISLATGTTLTVSGVTGGANHNGTSFALASGQTLKGIGTVSGAMVVRSGATLAPGSSIGTLNTSGVGNVTINSGGTLALELNIGGTPDADLLNVVGTLNVTGATLNLTLLDVTPGPDKTFLVAANNLSDGITGTFAAITGLPVGYIATLTYAYSGTDVLMRSGTGNDLAVTIITTIPEARAWLLVVVVGIGMAAATLVRGRRRQTGAIKAPQ